MNIQRMPLAKLTTLGVGGEAEVWMVDNHNELLTAMQAPYRILGGGSNLVVSDAGIAERVIVLKGELVQIDLNPDPQLSNPETVITGWIGAGKALPKLVRQIQQLGLSGAEGLVGIPATVGGAVWMNAGTRFGEMFDALYALEIAYNGKITVHSPNDFAYTYRHSGLPEGAIVSRVRLKLHPSTPEAVQAKMDLADQARKGQPKARTAGCAFKNPSGQSAGKLIDDAGLKGLQVGNAMISHEHGNFVINLGGATAQDVTALLDQVKQHLGVDLELEYEFWQ